MQFQFSRSFSLTFVLILNYLWGRHGLQDDHSWQRILTPYYMKIPHRLPIPHFYPFSFPSTATSTPIAFCLVSLAEGWSRHFWCVISLNDIIDLHMLNLGTLVSEEPCSKASCLVRSDAWYAFYAGALILYHIHIQSDTTHTEANRMTHPYNHINIY